MKKKLIIFNPHDYREEIFENLNLEMVVFSMGKWMEHRIKYNFNVSGWFQYLNFRTVYENVPKNVELWIITGRDIGITEDVPYDVYLSALEKAGFTTPPFGTGLWLPQVFMDKPFEINKTLAVFSPIPTPRFMKSYKTYQIKIRPIFNHKSDLYPSSFWLEEADLRPIESWLSPEVERIVQKINT